MERKMNRAGSRFAQMAALGAIAMLASWTVGALTIGAFAAGPSDEDIPATSIVPAAGATSSPGTKAVTSPASGAETTPAPAAKAKPKTVSRSTSSSAKELEVEPAKARLKLVSDAWVYAAPAKSSKHLEQVHKDKFVIVTGSTRYYLQVKLKDGQTGYIDPSAVALVTPTDKLFHLTHDAAVLDKPNRWAKKVSEVHMGRDVHVVGIALDYMRIRMKSGLEGFIPMTALQ